MNWKRLILWTAGIWIVFALLAIILNVGIPALHDSHAPHVEGHTLEKMEPRPPEEVTAEDLETPAHVYHGTDTLSTAEHIAHHIDEWLGILDVMADHSEGILLVFFLIGGGGNIAAWRASRKK